MRYIAELYEKHRALMYKFAIGRNHGKDEADDIVSEALQRLFRHASKLMTMAELQRLDYIVLTVKSVAEDHYRRRQVIERRSQQVREEDLIDPGLEDFFIERESRDIRSRILYETLAEVSEADRVLLVGKYMQNLSDEVLARQLGVKPSSIRMKLTRARKRARSIMERKIDDE